MTKFDNPALTRTSPSRAPTARSHAAAELLRPVGPSEADEALPWSGPRGPEINMGLGGEEREEYPKAADDRELERKREGLAPRAVGGKR